MVDNASLLLVSIKGFSFGSTLRHFRLDAGIDVNSIPGSKLGTSRRPRHTVHNMAATFDVSQRDVAISCASHIVNQALKPGSQNTGN